MKVTCMLTIYILIIYHKRLLFKFLGSGMCMHILILTGV